MDGSRHTVSPSRAHGRHVLPWLRRNRTNRLKLLLAPAILVAALFAYPALAGTNFYVATTGSNANNCTSAETPCLTIAGALAKATSGSDVVNVAAGTYAEALTITTPVTLNGAKAGIAAGPSASPADRDVVDGGNGFVGESVITSTLTIQANGVTIDGFVINVAGGHSVYALGANVNVRNNGLVGRTNAKTGGNSAITTQSSSSAESYVIEYNRISGGTYGINHDGDSNTVGLTFRGNYVTSVQRGVQTQGDTTGSQTITGNIFNDVTVGVRAARGSATITGNTFKNFEGTGTTQAAIRISSETYTQCYEGVPTPVTAGGATVQNNSMDGMQYGVIIEDPVAAPANPYTITTNSFTGITVNSIAIAFTGAGVAYSVTGCGTVNNLVGPFVLEPGTTIDASNNFWGVQTGPGSSVLAAGTTVTTSPFIASKTSSGSEPGFAPAGVVTDTGCTTTCYVSKLGSDSNTGSSLNPFLTIQRGLDAVSIGGTVRVAAGTYVEDLAISKQLTLRGPNYGSAAGDVVSGSLNSRVSEAVVEGATNAGASVTATGVVIDGMEFVRPSGSTANQHVRLVSGMTGGVSTTIRNSVFNMSVSGPAGGCGSAISSGNGEADLATQFILEYNAFLWHKFAPGGCANFNADRVIYLDSASPDNVIRDNYFYNTNHIYITDSAARTLVDGNYFRNTVDHAQIAVGNAQDVQVTDNIFTLSNGARGVFVDSAKNLLISGNRFSGGGRYHISLEQGGAGITISGNSFASLSSNPAIWIGEISPISTGVVITNNTFAASVDRVLYNCFSTNTKFNLNDVASTGPGSDVDAGKPIRNGGGFGGDYPCSGTRTLDATLNSWNGLSSPVYNDTGWTSTVTPSIASVTTYDLSKAGLPGYWPLTYAAGLDAISSPTVVPLAGADLGSPAITIPSAPAGATVTVTAPDPDELPEVTTPFKVDGATLIDISVSPGVTGPFTICLNGNIATDRLWHYEGGMWVDMTGRKLPSGSLDPATYPPGQICGMTATLSPFAMAEITDVDEVGCELAGTTLNVTMTSGSSLTARKSGTSVALESTDDLFFCLTRTTSEVRSLAIVGAGNPEAAETVTFVNATATNWGSLTTLARSVSAVEMVVLQGTENADTISVSTMVSISGSPTVRLEGGDGIDLLTGSSTTDVFIGGAGDDTFRGGTGNDCADYSAETVAVTASLTTGKGSGTGLGTDTYNSIECLKGGSGNDVLTGSAYADSLYGNAGNDTLSGRAGDDTLNGGSDTDTVSYAEQTSAVTAWLQSPAGGSGGSTIGTDTFMGIENLTGGAAGDLLLGDDTNNRLEGGAGNDRLVGMQGNDTFVGGSGTDTLSYDEVNFPGATTGSGAGLLTGVTVNLSTSSSQNTVGAGSDTIESGIENLTGSSLNDTLTGDGLVNVINGGEGNDTITGGAGNDTLNGQLGTDTLNGGDGADTLRGGDGSDSLFGNAGADVMYGEAGDDTLQGGTEGDTLRGGDGDDLMVGGLVGLGGSDVYYGEGGTGDTVSFAAAYSGATFGVTFKLSSVGTQQAVGGGAGTDVVGDAYIENLIGTAWTDSLVGNGLNNTIDAGGGLLNKVDGQAGTDTCTTTGTWAATYPKLCP